MSRNDIRVAAPGSPGRMVSHFTFGWMTGLSAPLPIPLAGGYEQRMLIWNSISISCRKNQWC